MTLADGAAEAGALALASGGSAAEAARAALPGWAEDASAVEVERRHGDGAPAAALAVALAGRPARRHQLRQREAGAVSAFEAPADAATVLVTAVRRGGGFPRRRRGAGLCRRRRRPGDAAGRRRWQAAAPDPARLGGGPRPGGAPGRAPAAGAGGGPGPGLPPGGGRRSGGPGGGRRRRSPSLAARSPSSICRRRCCGRCLEERLRAGAVRRPAPRRPRPPIERCWRWSCAT